MTDKVRFGRGDNARQVPDVDPVSSGNGRTIPQSPSQAVKAGKGVDAPKRKRAKAARSQVVVFLNFVFSLLIFVLIALGGAFYYGKLRFEEPGPLAQGTTFEVKPGSSFQQIATALNRQNIITDAKIFEFGARAMGQETALKAGEYEIKAGSSMKDVLATLVTGKAILHPITIVEGMTVAQAMQRIAENDILEGDMPTDVPPEGSLIADTQRFGRGTTRADIIARMQAQQQEMVEQIWAARAPDLPISTIEEFVTLASIVEKETGIPEERPQVAAVFVNRLRQGIRLQSDPTIIYGIFGGEGKPADRPIYRSDIDKETPYNTYQIDGLPPTPIAIPGRASLEAVAHPAQTEDLYFVADGTGGHVFAKTLEEHNRNVKRWREVEKQREADAKKAAGDAPKAQ